MEYLSFMFFDDGIGLIVVQYVEVRGGLEIAVFIVQPPLELNVPVGDECREANEQNAPDDKQHELPCHFTKGLDGLKGTLTFLVSLLVLERESIVIGHGGH